MVNHRTLSYKGAIDFSRRGISCLTIPFLYTMKYKHIESNSEAYSSTKRPKVLSTRRAHLGEAVATFLLAVAIYHMGEEIESNSRKYVGRFAKNLQKSRGTFVLKDEARVLFSPLPIPSSSCPADSWIP